MTALVYNNKTSKAYNIILLKLLIFFVSDTLKNLPNDTWIIANVRQVGYYRVNYDSDNWELLLEQLLDNHTVRTFYEFINI